MKSQIQNCCLEYIVNEWEQLQPLQIENELSAAPPWGVWIRLYEPIAYDQNYLHDHENTIIEVWFLTKQGLEKRDPWEYARFITANGFRPWSIMFRKPHEAVWGKKYHEIGLAAFAEIIDEDKVYLEMQWGSGWGRGYQASIKENCDLEIEKHMWIS